jgi:hypothetical protein
MSHVRPKEYFMYYCITPALVNIVRSSSSGNAAAEVQAILKNVYCVWWSKQEVVTRGLSQTQRLEY